MQINSNTTGMEAGLTVAIDKEGRDYCVVVIKGTFTIPRNGGEPKLADEQVPLVGADEFTGEPGFSAPLYECDYALHKPRCDVLLNGSAYAPGGRPTERVNVSLQVGSLVKSFDVVGNRVWQKRFVGITVSDPEPFTVMPISYNNAFGGVDDSHEDESKHETFLYNHAGVGFHVNTAKEAVDGKPLPNTEESNDPVIHCPQNYRPMAFGAIGRAWKPRVPLAGTYDQEWLDNVHPFLPGDFDLRYFQTARGDQQISYLNGGDPIRCDNLSPDGPVEFVVPRVEVPVTCRFLDRDAKFEPNLDTLIIEPDQSRFSLIWRATVPIGPKIHNLREVLVGRQPRQGRVGKRRFESLADYIAWKNKTGGRPPVHQE